jgi:hypothetical protein
MSHPVFLLGLKCHCSKTAHTWLEQVGNGKVIFLTSNLKLIPKMTLFG